MVRINLTVALKRPAVVVIVVMSHVSNQKPRACVQKHPLNTALVCLTEVDTEARIHLT